MYIHTYIHTIPGISILLLVSLARSQTQEILDGGEKSGRTSAILIMDTGIPILIYGELTLIRALESTRHHCLSKGLLP